MMNALKNFGGKKLGGLILIIVIIIAFGFGGFGGGFSTNNQNNIAKINKTNLTTQDFMDYVNQSGLSQEVIRNNLDNNVIEELLSGLISTTLINLEVKDFNLSINERTILKTIKENKNFHDENGIFQRVKYEKFLLSNNQSAPMFETPKNLPKICSLIAGYFSYDSIRYVEKIPNNCKNDLNLPDVRLMRPKTLVIHDNLKNEIFYIVNIFNDEKINNYQKKFDEIKSELFKLTIQSSIKILNKTQNKNNKNIKVKSNTSKNKFLNMVNKAKKIY